MRGKLSGWFKAICIFWFLTCLYTTSNSEINRYVKVENEAGQEFEVSCLGSDGSVSYDVLLILVYRSCQLPTGEVILFDNDSPVTPLTFGVMLLNELSLGLLAELGSNTFTELES